MREYTIGRLKGRFVVSWWEDGKRRRYRLDALDRKTAEREAIDVINQKTAAPSGYTVADLWEMYREDKKGRRVADVMQMEWKAIGPIFGHLRPDQITVEHSRQHTANRTAAGIKPGTIWTELGHLSTVFKWARDRHLIDRRPIVERPPKPAPKDRYLTHEEIQTLLATPMAHHLRVAILLMLSTAARPTAAMELTWDRVDFERRQIDLRTDADGPRKGRAIIAMNNGLFAALSDAKKVSMSEYVIEWSGNPVKSIKTALNTATEAAGLKGVTPHVFRHTAAVHLAAAGHSMAKISQYLGHSDQRVTERVYARFAPDHMRDEAATLDFAAPKLTAGGRYDENTKRPNDSQ
jgi:integrase